MLTVWIKCDHNLRPGPRVASIGAIIWRRGLKWVYLRLAFYFLQSLCPRHQMESQFEWFMRSKIIVIYNIKFLSNMLILCFMIVNCEKCFVKSFTIVLCSRLLSPAALLELLNSSSISPLNIFKFYSLVRFSPHLFLTLSAILEKTSLSNTKPIAKIVIIDAMIWSMSWNSRPTSKMWPKPRNADISISAPINACHAKDQACVNPTINDGVAAGSITYLNRGSRFAPKFLTALI